MKNFQRRKYVFFFQLSCVCELKIRYYKQGCLTKSYHIISIQFGAPNVLKIQRKKVIIVENISGRALSDKMNEINHPLMSATNIIIPFHCNIVKNS